MHWLLLSIIFGAVQLNCISAQQRVAPGVPPQHYQQQDYQQPMQHQGHHQQQMPVQQQQNIPNQQHVPMQQQQQYQQPQFQQQQVPMQQQHQPQQFQQPQGHQPQAHGGHAHHHGQPQQILNAANIAQEKEHIQEHMDVPMDTSKMTDQELQFHYFKMHDADNNNKLDGCELIKSLIHWHEQGNKEGQQQAEEKLFKDDELVALIDPILNMDDINKDGFIDYPEFIKAQEKAATAGRS